MKKNKKESNLNNLLQGFTITKKMKKNIIENRVVIYNRGIYEKQFSLDLQEKICQNFCNQNGWIVDKFFTEKMI